MKKLIFILSIVTLVSCSKSETKETENPMTLKVTMLTDYGSEIKIQNLGTYKTPIKNGPIKIVELYGQETIIFTKKTNSEWQTVEFEWQGIKHQFIFIQYAKVLLTLSKGSFTLKCI